ncbi:hypothetical protein CERSUDRAFT_63612 [Gelatoporia subvermispora B]|uniref:tRNA-splicing endonuclease subunit Sen54 N-terminal domain-containing protein n=1 Tax=Ceriporiopsis subvermispora (strain B) TaxID=914234 RepID=M2QSW6_CERS8|nr:hypothetical protein CERSUDRAFT_63612 [Gelatoporia subvermispora B]
MDDNIEHPTSKSQLAPPDHPEEDEQSSGDEDQGPDWTKLPSAPGARPVIPKRGEKDFEPIAAGGSGYQRHVLDRSRSAMLDALRAAPSISSKSASHAVWHPELARAHVTVPKGIVIATMGHSVARPSPDATSHKLQKRLELLPEEALYLIERGALFCRKAGEPVLEETERMDELDGVPMSVQQAFAEMIGKDDLTLEKYQVYAYLRRLGYAVTRAKPPTPEYPVPIPYSSTISLQTIFRAIFRAIATRLRSFILGPLDWWRPIKFSRWLHHNMDYSSLSRSLRLLPSGHDVPLQIKKRPNTPPSCYDIFYNLYKPSTPFKKTAPPPPDFSVVVVNARTTPIPTLDELATLFNVLPELPPPLPRRRQPFTPGASKAPAKAPQATAEPAQPDPPSRETTCWRRPFLWASSLITRTPPSDKAQRQTPRTNPFLALKSGNKMVVIAAVDAGTTTFFRFGQGVFKEWPML